MVILVFMVYGLFDEFWAFFNFILFLFFWTFFSVGVVVLNEINTSLFRGVNNRNTEGRT